MTAVLRLERAGTFWRARRQSYEVVLDGVVVAALVNGEATSVAIAPGRHALWLATTRYRSAVATFDVVAGETAAFRCHAGRRRRPVLEPDPTAAPLRGDTSRPSLRRPA